MSWYGGCRAVVGTGGIFVELGARCPDLRQLVSCGGIAQAGERLLCVVGEWVGGGDGLVAGLDGDGVVAAQGLYEAGDAPRGGSFDYPADGEGRHDDGEVRFDRVAFVVVDRPGPKITLGHPEALLDLPQLVISAHHVLSSRRLQIGDVALQPGQGTRFGLEVTVDAAAAAGELDEPVPLHRRLPGDRLL